MEWTFNGGGRGAYTGRRSWQTWVSGEVYDELRNLDRPVFFPVRKPGTFETVGFVPGNRSNS